MSVSAPRTLAILLVDGVEVLDERPFTAALDALSDGVFVKLEDAFLVSGEALPRWSPGGYTERRPRPPGLDVTVLTPPTPGCPSSFRACLGRLLLLEAGHEGIQGVVVYSRLR